LLIEQIIDMDRQGSSRLTLYVRTDKRLPGSAEK
jgi:hypothetical protein